MDLETTTLFNVLGELLQLQREYYDIQEPRVMDTQPPSPTVCGNFQMQQLEVELPQVDKEIEVVDLTCDEEVEDMDQVLGVLDVHAIPVCINATRRTITVAVEGNIGSGKSTFMAYLKSWVNHTHGDNTMCDTFEWNVEKWRNVDGINELGDYYQGTNVNGFQMTTYQTMDALYQKAMLSDVKVKLVKYSMASMWNVYSKLNIDAKTIDCREGDWLAEVNGRYIHDYPHHKIDLVIYCDRSPSACLDRIVERGRMEEQSIDVDYLKCIDDYYKAWLKSMPSVVYVDMSQDLYSKNMAMALSVVIYGGRLDTMYNMKQLELQSKVWMGMKESFVCCWCDSYYFYEAKDSCTCKSTCYKINYWTMIQMAYALPDWTGFKVGMWRLVKIPPMQDQAAHLRWRDFMTEVMVTEKVTNWIGEPLLVWGRDAVVTEDEDGLKSLVTGAIVYDNKRYNNVPNFGFFE